MSVAPSGAVLTSYIRKYRVLVVSGAATILDTNPGPVTPKNGTLTAGVTAGPNAVDLSALRCTFRVQKAYAQTVQFSELTIYNLAADFETSIMANGGSVIVEAGYENGNYGEIFRGNIFQPIRGKEEETTYFLRLVCLDGDSALNLGFCNFTMSNGKTARDIALQTARSSTNSDYPNGFPINVSGNLNTQASPRPRVVFGQPADVLRNVAQDNNAMVYSDGGVINIAPIQQTNKPTTVTAIPVNVHTGMIGMPQQVEYGVHVRVLINPQIKLNGYIYMNNKDIIQSQIELGQLQTLLDLDGLYRVIKITATGDTRGTDWYYDLETISQKGYLPDMLADPNHPGV